MNRNLTLSPAVEAPTRVRYGVLGFACALSMITYLDRVCFGTVAPYIQEEFGLSNAQKGWLFSAFALAYAAFEVPSGWMGDVFGPRKTLIRIVLWWSFFTALTGMIYPIAGWPWFAFVAMLAVRFLFGMGEAGAYPNITRSFHSWIPFVERGTAQGAVWSAGRFGGGITPLVVSVLMVTVVLPGGAAVVHWRHIFWIFGVLGIGWCVLWWWWFRDRPEDKAGVNAAELALIHSETPLAMKDAGRLPTKGHPALEPFRPGAPGHQEGITFPDEGRTGITVPSEPTEATSEQIATRPAEGGGAQEHITANRDEAGARSGVELAPPEPPHHDESGHSNVPWLKLMGSLNLWTLCLMYFCAAYGWYFNITYLPGYLKERYDVTPASWGVFTFGLMAGAPLLLGSSACLLGGLLTDAFIRRTSNRKWGRRIFGIIGHSGCALCYFLSVYAETPWLFVLAIALAAFSNDLTMGSAWAVCIDIGRRYSGIVSGCMNTVGNLGGFAAGIATALILDRYGWQANFALFGLVYVVAALLWLRIDSTKPLAPEHA